MSYVLLTLGAEAIGSGSGADQAQALDCYGALGQDLSGRGAEVVRTWQAPDSFIATPAYLVLRDAPNITDLRTLAADVGLRVLAAPRLIATDMEAGRIESDELDFEQLLPNDLPQTLVAGNLGALDLDIQAAIDPEIDVYVCCQGIGSHKPDCPYGK